MSISDTIAAVATASGVGGIGVVRVGTLQAAEIVSALVGGRALPDRRMVGCWARDPVGGEPLDQVLAVVMRGPASFTGEDVGEIHGHGGPLNLARLLRALLARGARAAEPGEFARRAFATGRIDLTRAEAVADLIGAASERARCASRRRAWPASSASASVRCRLRRRAVRRGRGGHRLSR